MTDQAIALLNAVVCFIVRSGEPPNAASSASAWTALQLNTDVP